MNLKRFALILCIGVAAAGFNSCKDDEDDTPVYDYLQGSISFDLPSYVCPGDVYTLEPTLVKRLSDDTSTNGFKCIWSVSELSIKDTLRMETDPASVPYTYVLTIPDTLCTISVQCSMAAEGYYTSSTSNTCIIVQPYGDKKSLTGQEFQDEEKVFTDPRDQKTYHYSSIAGLDWMAENLAFEGAGVPFQNAKAMTDIFGRLYTWEEASASCPPGWHLPDNEDFKSLCETYSHKTDEDKFGIFADAAGSLMVNAYLNEIQLWEYWPEVKISNESRLSVLPVGYAARNGDSYKFSGSLSYAAFWTADPYKDDQAYYRMIHVKQPDILIGAGSKSLFAASVRCVRKTN